MTNFEKLYATILGEQTAQQHPAQAATNQAANTSQTTPAPVNSTSKTPQDDQQLLELLKQKLNDQKFKDQLMKMLQPANQTVGSQTPPTNTTSSTPQQAANK
jgi:hypothetical protein